jgi:hypothetical protein
VALLGLLLLASATRAGDSAAVERIPQDFSLRAGLQTVSLTLKRRTDNSSYVPNRPLRVSVGFVYGELGIGGSVSLPYAADTSRPATSILDFQLHRYTQRWIASLYFQRYRGFARKGEGQGPAEDPSLVALQTGAMLQRVVVGDGLSYRAAFRHDYRQLRSGFELLAGAAAYLSDASSDSLPVAGTKREISTFQFGPCAGLAWSLVPFDDWLFHASGAGGLYLAKGGIDEDPFAHGVSLKPSWLLRFSASRDIGNWSVGLSFLESSVLLRGPEKGFAVETKRADLYVVRRFGSGGVRAAAAP